MKKPNSKPWPEDAPSGKTWVCPECGSLASLGDNAGYHRDKYNHAEPFLKDCALFAIKSVVTHPNAEWLIWSIEHRSWWKPNRCGYTVNREDAGRYTLEDACEIVRSANIGVEADPNETMVRDDLP